MTRIGRRVKILTGYAAHARFSAACAEAAIGEIPTEIRQPYRSSPTHQVLNWRGAPVLIVETRHRRYEVYTVIGPVDPLTP